MPQVIDSTALCAMSPQSVEPESLVLSFACIAVELDRIIAQQTFVVVLAESPVEMYEGGKARQRGFVGGR